MAQRHGSSASLAVVVGCSPTVPIDPASASPLAVAGATAGQGCGSLSGRITGFAIVAAADSWDGFSEYPEGMNESSSRPLGRTVVAGLILLVAAWVLLHFVIGIVTAVASVLVVVLAIVAIIWALRVLL
jgi:hypothetical protein